MSLNQNFLPLEVLDLLDVIPAGLADKTAEELEAMFNYDTLIRKVRTAFWCEYEYSVGRMQRLKIQSVAKRCGYPLNHILATIKNPKYLAYICCPIEAYENYLDEALGHGLKRVRDELLTIPIQYVDDSGVVRYNMKAAELLLKTVAFLDVRKNGMPKQKIEQTTIHGRPKEFKEIMDNTNLELIEKRIKELENSGVTSEAAHRILVASRVNEDAGDAPTTKTLGFQDVKNIISSKNISKQEDEV